MKHSTICLILGLMLSASFSLAFAAEEAAPDDCCPAGNEAGAGKQPAVPEDPRIDRIASRMGCPDCPGTFLKNCNDAHRAKYGKQIADLMDKDVKDNLIFAAFAEKYGPHVLQFFAMPAHNPGQTVTGKLHGTVRDASNDNRACPGVKVDALLYTASTPITAGSAVSDEAGEFTIADLPIRQVAAIGVQADYDGVTYSSDWAILAAERTEAKADLAVRRTTADTSSIAIQRLHTMVDLTEGQMQVSEVAMATNSGDRTIVRKDGSFRMSLPAGATEVKLSGDFDQAHSKITGDAAISMNEFKPGTKQFVAQYVLSYDSGMLNYVHRLDYDTAAYDFIFPDVLGTSIASKDFASKRVVQMGQRPYQYLSGKAGKAGSTLNVSITLPVAPRNVFRWPALALAGIAAVGFGSLIARNLKTKGCFGHEIWLAGIAMHFAVLAGLVYAPSATAGDVQRIMYFHVPSAWVSFLAFFVTFLASIAVLGKRSEWWDGVAVASAEIGILFCTLALVTGSIWGKAAWNVWWVWDARLSTTLILWLIYAAYLVLRMSVPSAERLARLSAVYAITGFAAVPVVFMSIRLWRTQHPPAVVMGGQGGLEPQMLYALLFCVGAFTLLYIALLRGRVRLEQARRALL